MKFPRIVCIRFVDHIHDRLAGDGRLRAQDGSVDAVRNVCELAPELQVPGFEVGARLAVDPVRNGPLAEEFFLV